MRDLSAFVPDSVGQPRGWSTMFNVRLSCRRKDENHSGALSSWVLVMDRNMRLPAGQWILAQDITAKDSLWYKVLILTEMDVKVIDEQSDGWVICESVQTQLRYKVWTHDLLERG